MITPDGREPRHVVVNADRILGPGDELVGAVATMRDETERLAAERESRRLAAIVDSSDDAIISETLKGIIMSWNAGAERLYGYTPREAIGQPVSLIVPPELRSEVSEILHRVASAERVERHETQRVHKDGRRIDISLTMSPIFDAASRIAGASVIAHDVGEIKRSERMFSDLMEFAPDAILASDAGGRITLINSQAVALFGYEAEALLGMQVDELLPERMRGLHAEHRAGYFEHPAHRDMGPGLELFGQRKDGTEFPCEVSLSAIETDDGEVALAAVRDITERRQLEQEAERLKSEFFALVSHELRTPLTSIVGYTDVLSEDESQNLSEEGRHFLDIISRNTQRLDRLVQDLLLVAQVDSGSFEVEFAQVDAASLAADCLEASRPAAEEAGVELSLDAEPVDQFGGDSSRLGQVLDNLVSNAIKFTPAGGSVVVSVGRREDDCVLEVADNGLGIGPSEQKHLFDRFYRAGAASKAHIKGVGLGLAIVKAIVEAHGGRIEIDSEEGRGSTFTVLIPMAEVRVGDSHPMPAGGKSK